MARGRRPLPALTITAAYLAVAVLVAADAGLRARPDARSLVLATAAAGLLLLGLARFLQRAGFLGWGILLLGAAYAETVVAGPRAVDLWAPVVGAALLVVGECGYWSLHTAARFGGGPAADRRRALTVMATALGGAALGAVALGSSLVLVGPTVALLALVCFAALAAMVVALAWR